MKVLGWLLWVIERSRAGRRGDSYHSTWLAQEASGKCSTQYSVGLGKSLVVDGSMGRVQMHQFDLVEICSLLLTIRTAWLVDVGHQPAQGSSWWPRVCPLWRVL